MTLPGLGSARTENVGLNIAREAIFAMGFLFRDLPTLDYGLDGQIEIVARMVKVSIIRRARSSQFR
jgi:hypothetical protein